MNAGHRSKVHASYGPCPPEEFAGRFDERVILSEVLQEARYRGQAIMLSGARGSGKTSFIEWAEHEIQNEPELKGLAIKKPFPDAPGMIFATYLDLLRDLKGHQKFGWFKKTLDRPRVKKSIGAVLDALEKASPLAGPAKVGVDAGAAVTRAFLPHETVDYTQLFTSFISALNALSDELTNEDKFLAILLDDVQWSSEPDFRLLKYLIQNPPPAIVFIITFRLEAGSMAMYDELRRELDRFGYTEIRLSGMAPDEIKDFANLRYGLSVDDQAAEFLNKKIGDPFCLVRCFNLLQRRNQSPSIASIQDILPEVVEPVRSIYSELGQPWKDRFNPLCILRPPMSLSLIACMLKEMNMVRLQDELDQSVVFIRLKREEYDFVHSSLREYLREELPELAAVELHSQAARCFETLRGRFDEWSADLSLAEHLFFGQEYDEALELNLRLGDRLYDLFDYRLALQLTERAKTCAEKTNNRDKLAAALHQKGTILKSMFRFSDSLDAYNQSLKIKREIGDLAYEAATLHQIGMVYEDTNRFEEALDFYKQSLEITREIGDLAGEAMTLHQIGMVYQLTNRFDEALDFYNQSLEITREIGNLAGEAMTLHQIGMVYQLTNRFDEALDFYKQSLKIKREIGNLAYEASTLHQIGRVYQLTNRFEEALDFYKQSLKIERELGDLAGEAMTLHQIGRVYEVTNRFEEALDFYNQSLKITREIGNLAGEASTLHQIGMVYEATNRFDEALDFYNQSLKIEREIGNKSGEAISLRTIEALKEEMLKKK